MDPQPTHPIEQAVQSTERATPEDATGRRRRPWLLIALTAAVWLGVVVVVVVSYVLTRQPPVEPVPIGG